MPERRALQLAAAVVTDPEVLLVDAVLSGLTGDAAAYVLRALASCATGRRVIASIDQSDLSAPSAEAAFARSASYLAVFARGALVLEGRAEELLTSAAVYTLDVRSNVDALREELSQRGIELRGSAPHFAVTVPRGSGSREILDAARAARAAVVEMAPVIG